jgi:hypothetical protein
VARARQIEPTPAALERLFADGDFALGHEAKDPKSVTIWMGRPSQVSSIGSRASARCSMAVKRLHDRRGKSPIIY